MEKRFYRCTVDQWTVEHRFWLGHPIYFLMILAVRGRNVKYKLRNWTFVDNKKFKHKLTIILIIIMAYRYLLYSFWNRIRYIGNSHGFSLPRIVTPTESNPRFRSSYTRFLESRQELLRLSEPSDTFVADCSR